MSLPENLKRVREERGYSQAELSRKAGVSQPMITQIERGTKAPTVLLCKALADALNCSLYEITGE